MPQNAFFPQICDLLVGHKTTQSLFFTLHLLALVIFATSTVVAFVLLRNSRFNFYCYTQREATTPTQESAWKWRCGLLRLLARKITKGIHLCKPASLNRPIGSARGGGGGGGGGGGALGRKGGRGFILQIYKHLDNCGWKTWGWELRPSPWASCSSQL